MISTLASIFRKITTMKAFILLAVVAVAFAREQCGENEHYTGCGTDCPLTCDNYDNPPKFCNLMCRIGCECDKGYVRSSVGRCVRPEQCPARTQEQQCGENEHYTGCGTDCPLTCDNYDNPPKFCNLMCRIGCECDKGYVRSSDGRCIRPEQCPARTQEHQCGENEHFNGCGTDCPLTCDNYYNPPKFCNLMCRIGCECDQGYVRSSDGRCVRPQECPARAPECGENQHYTTCGTSCPLTCDNYSNPPKICNKMCNVGCYCDEGFVLTREGQCIRSFQCPLNATRPEVETCTDEPEPGRCMAYFPMWYYDAKSGECKRFVYGGCGGNGNRYNTEEECLSKCQGVKASPSASCTLPAETGVCRGRFPRYFFDVQTGTCREFVYGGCGGNENNFETIEECENTCAPRRAPEACLQEKVTGPCRGLFSRYYYNKESGQCEEFIYGGCNGNSNNFNSKDECESVCSS